MKDGKDEKDGLDEWIDELDRIIGVEHYSEEELKAMEEKEEQRPRDPLIYVAVVIVIAIILVLLLLFRII